MIYKNTIKNQDPLPGRPEKIDYLLHDQRLHEEIEHADLIFCIDESTGAGTIEFGRATLTQIVKTGKAQSTSVAVVCLKVDTLEYEALLAVILTLKGYYDNTKAKQEQVDVMKMGFSAMTNKREVH